MRIACLILLVIVFLPCSAFADRVVETNLRISVLDNTIIAATKDGRSIVARLKSGERLLWSAERENFGAALTNYRLLTVSGNARSWSEIQLRAHERGDTTVAFSSKFALAVTPHRIVGFDAEAGREVEARIEAGESIVRSDSGTFVAVVATDRGAFGYAAGSGVLVKVRFDLNEAFESLRVDEGFATLKTSRRLLTFGADSGKWTEAG